MVTIFLSSLFFLSCGLMNRLNSNESSFSEGNFELWNLVAFHWIQWLFIEWFYMQGAKWNKKINKVCSDWLFKEDINGSEGDGKQNYKKNILNSYGIIGIGVSSPKRTHWRGQYK